jgi:hypothetical protein
MTASGPQTALLVATVAKNLLQLVQGFQDCGVAKLARADISNMDDLRSLLSTRLFKSNGNGSQRTDSETPVAQQANAAEAIASWSSAEDSKDGAHPLEVHVYQIDLYSKFAEGLVSSGSLKDLILCFRWSKIHAIYGQLQNTLWRANLAYVLEDAKCRAGDRLKVSVVVLTEEQWNRHRLDGYQEVE